ncbi:hypothetical protein IMCC14465_13780 [alpha proteobacterium IMCC14465]|uniref:Uncharacterized protein n=1 Tax=alpha proteobacterium IMCC14465 TaxID=1220535 RepID=J9DX56_9PROT|nr:hypothetical protein IMCC14465_13780 [alpha proteobacterium IMCC14465]
MQKFHLFLPKQKSTQRKRTAAKLVRQFVKANSIFEIN